MLPLFYKCGAFLLNKGGFLTVKRKDRKMKKPGDTVSFRLREYESPLLIDWLNSQSDIAKSIRFLIEKEINNNGIRDNKTDFIYGFQINDEHSDLNLSRRNLHNNDFPVSNEQDIEKTQLNDMQFSNEGIDISNNSGSIEDTKQITSKEKEVLKEKDILEDKSNHDNAVAVANNESPKDEIENVIRTEKETSEEEKILEDELTHEKSDFIKNDDDNTDKNEENNQESEHNASNDNEENKDPVPNKINLNSTNLFG